MAYHVTEIFYSLQGEGQRAGTANVFVRFAGCNLSCSLAKEGFNCDTDFTKRAQYDNAYDLAEAATQLWAWPERHRDDFCLEDHAVIFTGGEPALQVDSELVSAFLDRGFYVAMETNGTKPINAVGLHWVACSPKPGAPFAEENVGRVDEFRFVVGPDGRTAIDVAAPPEWVTLGSRALFLSPAFDLDTNLPYPEALRHSIDLCLRNPGWRLSVQQHKFWGVK